MPEREMVLCNSGGTLFLERGSEQTSSHVAIY